MDIYYNYICFFKLSVACFDALLGRHLTYGLPNEMMTTFS